LDYEDLFSVLNGFLFHSLRYCIETLVLREEEKRTPETSQMRFACNLVGLTLRDRMRTEDIREQLKMKWIDKDIREYQKK
jgi:hypothetical protein